MVIVLTSEWQSNFSMLNAFGAQDLDECHPHYLEIEQKRSPLQILIVELYLDGDRQFITSVHLCPAGQPGHKHVNASLGPECYQIVLVEQCWTRPDETQVAR